MARCAAFLAPAACAPSPPPRRAPRQSLPTRRERRWLAERRIGREDARPVYSSFQQSFQLRVWNLELVSPPCETPRGDRPPVRGAEAAPEMEAAAAAAAEAAAAVEAVEVLEAGCADGEAEAEGNLALDAEADTGRAKSRRCADAGRASRDGSVGKPRAMVSGHLSRRRARGAGEPSAHDGGGGDTRHDRPVKSTLTRAEAAAVLTWAYVVHMHATKSTLGKRAVVRNRAKRRVAAAVRAVFPAHACRGRQYSFLILPAALVTPLPDLLEEARVALVETCSFKEQLSEAELRRPWYSRPR